MRRSDHPSCPSARICCCLVSSKTLLMSATELAFRADVNVSIATGNGRVSAVHQWPVLGVHRGPLRMFLAVWFFAHGLAHLPCFIVPGNSDRFHRDRFTQRSWPTA